MKILLTGARGQLGRELHRQLPLLGPLLGNTLALDRTGCDLSRPEHIPKLIGDFQPDIIVNAAAYTAVDKAEEEEALATAINGAAVEVMAEQAKKHNALLLHYSTDYIFDGNKEEPYTEDDIPNPINAYGRSKLAGEQAVRQSDCEHLIVRTSWVYSVHGNNFLNTMLRLMKEREQLRVVSDQHGAPTSVNLIASVTLEMLKAWSQARKQDGAKEANTYHLCAAGQTTWYDFAEQIRALFNQFQPQDALKTRHIAPVTTADYKTLARRPRYSRLSCNKLENRYHLQLPDWLDELKTLITEKPKVVYSS